VAHDPILDAAVAALAETGTPLGGPIVDAGRRPLAYRTTFPIDDITIDLGDRAFGILFKNLNRDTLPPALRRAKPAFLHDPRREIRTYERVLAHAGVGTPAVYGAVVDDPGGRYWLFIEKVPGATLAETGDIDLWRAAARWLARMHARLGPLGREVATECRLLRHDAAFFRRWMLRALQFATPERRPAVEWIAARHERIVDCLLSVPPTFLHGEFYASNILVSRRAEDVRVCPVDWEMAALGPPVSDLASLISGNWSAADRASLVEAYRQEQEAGSPAHFAPDSDCALRSAQVQISIQWLGWSRHWKPPAEHQHDWLECALRVLQELE
jgi:aminoglycoside phosphotransferase (APT) family kinase protein